MHACEQNIVSPPVPALFDFPLFGEGRQEEWREGTYLLVFSMHADTHLRLNPWNSKHYVLIQKSCSQNIALRAKLII